MARNQEVVGSSPGRSTDKVAPLGLWGCKNKVHSCFLAGGHKRLTKSGFSLFC